MKQLGLVPGDDERGIGSRRRARGHSPAVEPMSAQESAGELDDLATDLGPQAGCPTSLEVVIPGGQPVRIGRGFIGRPRPGAVPQASPRRSQVPAGGVPSSQTPPRQQHPGPIERPWKTRR